MCAESGGQGSLPFPGRFELCSRLSVADAGLGGEDVFGCCVCSYMKVKCRE